MSRTKPRVHELAKELGVTSRELLRRLSDEGEMVNSASSVVAAPVARRLRGSHQSASARPERPVADHDGPKYFFVRERDSSGAVHHHDYVMGDKDRALCGIEFVERVAVDELPIPDQICPRCEARLPEYHAKFWQQRFTAVSTELVVLRQKYEQSKARCHNQQRQISALRQGALPARPRRATKPGAVATPGSKSEGSVGKKKPRQKSSRGSAIDPTKPHPASTAKVGRSRTASRTSAPDPAVVRKRVKEMTAPARKKSAAERESDLVVADRMRSQKPSTWRVGRSPSSYG